MMSDSPLHLHSLLIGLIAKGKNVMLDESYWLIFGGCCSNVFALEAIVKHEPDSGLLITANQLALVSLLTLSTQLTRNDDTTSILPYRFRTPAVPIQKLGFMAAMFFVVNMMNNWAFAFDISVPMHIILRSFGSVQTLVVGWCFGRKYSRIQVFSVFALTVGVVVAAWADAASKGKNLALTALGASSSPTSFYAGLFVLFMAQLISAFMGVYTEQTYALHGRHWRENLFYSHFIGLLLSFAFWPQILDQYRRLLVGPKAVLPLPKSIRNAVYLVLERVMPAPILRGAFGIDPDWRPPQSIVLLMVNSLTQFACIGGVNRLSAQTTAVTVTVVLNIRKLVSFLLSCVIFGNKLSNMMAVGAVVVFASGALYGWESSRLKSVKSTHVKEEKDKELNGNVVKHHAVGK